jgi:hypothetical protein
MFSSKEEPAGRTIVGGRPPGGAGGPGGVPRGIEVLLRKARVDAAFREVLLGDPSAAAESIGLPLSGAEQAVLASVPREQLAAMADRIEVPEEHRRVFKGRAAAAMLAALAGSFLAGCPEPPVVTGIRPEERPPTTEQAEPAPPKADPDEPPDAIRGVRADDPESDGR